MIFFSNLKQMYIDVTPHTLHI